MALWTSSGDNFNSHPHEVLDYTMFLSGLFIIVVRRPNYRLHSHKSFTMAKLWATEGTHEHMCMHCACIYANARTTHTQLQELRAFYTQLSFNHMEVIWFYHTHTQHNTHTKKYTHKLTHVHILHNIYYIIPN